MTVRVAMGDETGRHRSRPARRDREVRIVCGLPGGATTPRIDGAKAETFAETPGVGCGCGRVRFQDGLTVRARWPGAVMDVTSSGSAASATGHGEWIGIASGPAFGPRRASNERGGRVCWGGRGFAGQGKVRPRRRAVSKHPTVVQR